MSRKQTSTLLGVACGSALILSFWFSAGIEAGGHWIPTHPPDEANRVRHASGFSIVRPHDWVSVERPFEPAGQDTIVIDPGCKGMRYSPRIGVARLTRPPELGEFSKATLGSYEAHRKLDVQVGGGDTPYFSCEYVVPCGETWFRIVYLTPNGSWGKPRYHDVPVEVTKYLETFTCDDEKANEEGEGFTGDSGHNQ